MYFEINIVKPMVRNMWGFCICVEWQYLGEEASSPSKPSKVAQPNTNTKPMTTKMKGGGGSEDLHFEMQI